MLRELEEAVMRGFRIASDREDARIVADDWESRLHISQVGKNLQRSLIRCSRCNFARRVDNSFSNMHSASECF